MGPESESHSELYTKLCTVVADIREAVRELPPLHGPDGTYFRFNFEIELLFGPTEHKAYICWKENVSNYVSISNRSRFYPLMMSSL